MPETKPPAQWPEVTFDPKTGKFDIPFGRFDREKMTFEPLPAKEARRRGALLALLTGVQELPLELEIGAFADIANAKGWHDVWAELTGYKVPRNQAEWYVLLGAADIPAECLVNGKIRPRDVLAYLLGKRQRQMAVPTNAAGVGTKALKGGGGQKMLRAEANVKARDYLKDNPQKATVRNVATAIGCASGMVSKLPAWKAFNAERNNRRKPKAPKAVSFTPKLEAVTGTRDAELERLTQEQADDERHGQRLRDRKP